jgi:2-polyprenyl-3-methyl-5-hydroxy-6-metoxy-1,4-benzoquinol methylase
VNGEEGSPKRVRVRPAYTPDQLYRLYAEPWGPHDSEIRRVHQAEDERAWIEAHGETRTFQGVVVAMGIGFGKVGSIADMSCGSGDIARRVAKYSGIEPMLGDLGPGYPYRGTLQETVPQLPMVDLFICTETVEHLDDPDADLALIRQHCKVLLLSTPVDEDEAVDGAVPADGHYWVWSREGVEEMLGKAGFRVIAFNMLDMTPELWTHCRFGMWMCK